MIRKIFLIEESKINQSFIFLLTNIINFIERTKFSKQMYLFLEI